MARVHEDTNKQWIANRDFDLRNLNVEKGTVLPKNWSTASSRSYLQDAFGPDCIIWTDKMINANTGEGNSSEIEILKEKIGDLERRIALMDAGQSKSPGRKRISR